MRSLLPAWRAMLPVFILCVLVYSVYGEGTRQLAPNANITINNATTNDVAALHIANLQFNNFAAYNNNNPNSRLNIHISDPSNECIFLGFSEAHLNRTTPNPPGQDFEYRILDPSGNVIFGPVQVLQGQANIQEWSQAFEGPFELAGPTGYNATMVSSSDLSSGGWSGSGDYYIEFRNLSSNEPFLIDYWDISVVDCSSSGFTEKTGRIWSYNWALFAINDFGFPSRPFNGSFYVCAPDPVNTDAAFITRIDFNGSGFRPAAFNVAFNSFGTMNTGNIEEDRRSVENMNVAVPEYAIFLNDPIDICETAEGGDISLLGISSCDGQNYCIKFISTRSGQIDLFLDFDGRDNIFSPGTADVMITASVSPSQVGQELCLDWDGKNGLGEDLSGSFVEVPVNFSFAQGIYHFPIYDAELMTTGFEINAVRPTGPDPLLYYDDSNISVASGTGEPAIQLSGCNLPCHGWTNYTDPGTVGFGNLNTINSWWFSSRQSFESVFTLPGRVECFIEGPASVCEGDSIVLRASHQIIPAGSEYEIINQTWRKVIPAQNLASNVDSLIVTEGGLYQYDFTWVNAAGDTCEMASCARAVMELPSFVVQIDTLIDFGDSLEINGETYTDAGEYIQEFQTSDGCDSLVIIRLDYEDAVYTCEIIGDGRICFGDTSLLEVLTFLEPVGAPEPPLLAINWSGPGLTQQTGSTVLATQQGVYTATVTWLDSAGEQQSSSCTFLLELDPRFSINIDTLITEGETLFVEALEITEPGSYEQFYQTVNGCDSTVTINVISQDAVVRYDFEDCRSVDYSLLGPDYPDPVVCAEFSAGNIFRENAEVNGHSCTPGVDGGVAMCISSLESCSYEAGSDKSLIFELEVRPKPDSAIQITSLNFFERAPEEFQWIVGYSGPNNYPLLYGLRVLRDGQEIYRIEERPTSLDWNREVFSFTGLESFRVEEASTFRFELLPYCPVGIDSPVNAWDIDELSVQASCALAMKSNIVVQGRLNSRFGSVMPGVDMFLETAEGYLENTCQTGSQGDYAFENVSRGEYILAPVSPNDDKTGVSSIDLILIQKHILGIERFTDPYDYIAADADDSKTLTANDIIELQRLILGIDQELKYNSSWRFNHRNNITLLDNPWSIRENLKFSLQDDGLNIDFDGIKIGDLDGSHRSHISKSIRTNYEMPLIYIENTWLQNGDTKEISIQSAGQNHVSALQLGLVLEGLTVVDLTSDEGLLQWHLEGSQLRISYLPGRNYDDSTDPEPVKIKILIKARRSGYLNQYVKLDSSWQNAIYMDELSSINIQELNFERAEENEIDIWPNPFNDSFQVGIKSAGPKEATMSLYAMNGQRVYMTKLIIKEGYNRIDVTPGLNIGKGVFLGLLEDEGGVVNFRVLRL